MQREEMRKGLENAGFSSYEADAFLTLLEHGVSPAVEIAKNCSVPTPRIYDVLKDLERKGYVETVERDKLHARARDPVNVIEDLHDQSELLSDTASEIEDRWEQSPLGEHEMNVVGRVDTVVNHAEDLIREADTVVDMAVTAEQLLEFETALEAVDDDVLVRVSVYCDEMEPSAIEDSSVQDLTTEIRGREIPCPLLVLVDRTSACFSPTTRMPDPYGVVVNDDIISFIFQWYFQTCLWSVWDEIYKHQDFPIEYVNLDEFICDVFPFWRDGQRITATVDGIHTGSGERREITGTIDDIAYTGMDITTDENPTVAELAGQATVTLSTDDHAYKIGSWGAIFEDIEARRIVLRSIEFDDPDVTDIGRVARGRLGEDDQSTAGRS